MTDAAWEKAHCAKEWGRHPTEHLVRFIYRHYPVMNRVENRGPIFSALDIGCGAGASLRFLCDHGFAAHGIDVSVTALRRAQDWKAHVYEMSAEQIEFAPANFDVVIDICTLQHVEKLETAFNQVMKVLKPGGRFFSMMAAPHHAKNLQPEGAFMRFIELNQLVGMLGNLPLSYRIDRSRYTIDGGNHTIAHWLIEGQRK